MPLEFTTIIPYKVFVNLNYLDTLVSVDAVDCLLYLL
jgi:hypothetical protein